MLALYGHPFSSYTWKGLIPLYATGAGFEFREVGPDEPDHSDFVARSHPAGKFPVLVDGDTTVIEATSIVEHLALKYPASGLIPADPAEAAIARMLDRVFDNYVMGSGQRVVNAFLANMAAPDQAEIEAGKAGLRRAYRWLESWLAENALPAHVSLVSCAAAPSLFYADWIEPIPATAPRLAALRAELLALPEVSRCVEDARPFRPWFPPGAPDRD
ncbi:glutathione S-transferase family protein [Altererythrobacter sp. CC-YST694]|uniref:glutathione S-transferase family protein n=1 Tax=Altererythrobacter sp. CC-YST694 TaxID=2755038 RepID=UPI001D001D0F|nr:glutathione S-transferase family protein [Altererythrobacter sp. CC-YST694]MCB5424906.1 glutathione S-transferase family protein [Altererythrobacter sp. CC-YST694]